MAAGDPRVTRVEARAFTVPTESPESDATLRWEQTTAVVARASGGGATGTGYTYSHRSAAGLVADTLAPVIRGRSVMDTQVAWRAMVESVRNFGRDGIAAAAISAVDAALWDLKSKVLQVPLVSLLGQVREAVPTYGSGGFTSEPVEATIERFEAWSAHGIGMFKMKVGRHPERDVERVGAVRESLEEGAELFVDANGAYRVAEAVEWAARFGALGVRYFEEPVSSDDVDGLRRVRERAPPGLAIAAGEYGWSMPHLRRLLTAGAVDVLQLDGTRCGGITGLTRAAGLAFAWMVPVSTHTAHTVHAHAACALEPVVHMELFHDHERVEALLFDGAARPEGGSIRPDLSRPGAGFELKLPDAERWEVRA